jgi:hypothetical protein
LRAVADLLLEELGLLLDGAEAVLDGIVGGAEVGGDVANVDLGWSVICFGRNLDGRSEEIAGRAHLHSRSNDSSDKLLPDFDGVPGELAWSSHG